MAEQWHRYYGEKRIGQQWKQLDLVGRFHAGGPVLEIGPYLGLVTACLVNAGYDVTTLDIYPRQFAQPVVEHIRADLRTLDPARIMAFRTVLCCETLEHVEWSDVDLILRTLRQPSRRLIISVPYQGWQLFAQLYVNGYGARQHFQWRKLRSWRAFPAPENDGPMSHKWEVGYRGRSLADWEGKLQRAGWQILAREFTSPARSVFHVLQA